VARQLVGNAMPDQVRLRIAVQQQQRRAAAAGQGVEMNAVYLQAAGVNPGT
jgi:hypothetical protein